MKRKEEGLVTVTGQAYVMRPLDNACHVVPAGFETGEDMEILGHLKRSGAPHLPCVSLPPR